MKKRAVILSMIFSIIVVLFSSNLIASGLQLNLSPWINLTSPNGGESLLVGSKHNITWQKSESGGTVQLHYSVNSGTNWIYINSVSGNGFEWTVPDNVTTQARVRVRWTASDTKMYTSISDADFTIYKPIADGPLLINLVPAAPTDLKADAKSFSEIKLTWKDNSNNESGYKLERKITANAGGFTEIEILGANVTEYTDTGLNSATSYTYRVRAYNAQGTSPFSNEASATTTLQLIVVPIPGAPAAPTQLKAEVKSSTIIALSWKDNATNEDIYSIERKINDNNFEEIGEAEMNSISYEDLNLLPGTKYTYRLRAKNDIGYSAYSNEEAAVTSEDPILQPQPLPVDGVLMKLYINKSEYFVNDKLLTMDTVPIISNSRTLLPIRYVAEALGATVAWNGAEEKVTIKFKETTIELWINKKDARVNGVMEQIDPSNTNVVPVILPPGRTMLPLRFIAENLGSSVEWEPIGQEVIITYPKK
jgi:uncharacterized protein